MDERNKAPKKLGRAFTESVTESVVDARQVQAQFAEMNGRLLSLSRYKFAAPGMVVGFVCLLAGSASAQNLLGNPSFESPLGTGATNWTVGYLQGGPDDFEIKDRTTVADRKRSQLGNTRGAHFRPVTDKLAHAYFTQTVTNLTPGHAYTVSGWVLWEGGQGSGFGNAATAYRVYFEAIGGLGRVASPNAASEFDGTNWVDQWHQYSLTQTADANGRIEIRLHLDKFGWCTYDKLILINGYFDDMSVTY